MREFHKKRDQEFRITNPARKEFNQKEIQVLTRIAQNLKTQERKTKKLENPIPNLLRQAQKKEVENSRNG